MIVRALSVIAGCLLPGSLDASRSAAAAAPSAGVPGPAILFQRDVMPLLTRLGCGSAQCHGAFSGQGSMTLSLFGGSPVDDYETIVKAERARRVNRWDPPRSLLLLKATAAIDQGGGRKIAPDSEEFRTLAAAINGSPRIKRLIEAQASDAEIVEELFLAALSRLPRESEKQAMTDYLAVKTVRSEPLGRIDGRRPIRDRAVISRDVNDLMVWSFHQASTDVSPRVVDALIRWGRNRSSTACS